MYDSRVEWSSTKHIIACFVLCDEELLNSVRGPVIEKIHLCVNGVCVWEGGGERGGGG